MTTTPRRIQRRRTKGWRAPEGARYVGRGTPFGNPWAVVQTNTGTGWAVQWAGHTNQHRPPGLKDFVPANGQHDAHTLAVELYEIWVHAHPTLPDRIRRDLAARDLMCWCPPELPCHADVLLELANSQLAAA
ncbi:DUF4326 domain-containing protein [Streptomyces sp. SS1-1]|uniref:DUF4326 domain-containing protein n=1 Tax=Streptomyces sp. SS1-1 TaxID=2651869 RepID=UPI001250904D|nr:DUF4326 domain-containing protein [Streptomyces sp. SS1-1]KAB2976007.1 DUF4326 domain-containing protein [Streptomyces sp. SS1-1]